MATIEAHGLRKSYGSSVALDGIELDPATDARTPANQLAEARFLAAGKDAHRQPRRETPGQAVDSSAIVTAPGKSP